MCPPDWGEEVSIRENITAIRRLAYIWATTGVVVCVHVCRRCEVVNNYATEGGVCAQSRFVSWSFTSRQHLRSYHDGYRFMTVCTYGNQIVLLHHDLISH